MQAVILTAGEGIRLRPYTTTCPKGMIPVANKPLLEHLVEGLASCGVKRIVMVVGYHKEVVMSHFGDGQDWKVDISYARQAKPLGTGNALLAARKLLDPDDYFMVLPGDNYLKPSDLRKLLDRPGPAVLVTESDNPAKYGVVKLARGKVTGIYEKEAGAGPTLISTGTYKLPPFLLDFIAEASREGNHILSEVIGRAVGGENLGLGTVTASGWVDAVYPWDLLNLNDLALRSTQESMGGKLETNVVVKGSVVIGEGTVIRSGCYLEGPLHIGEGCDIGPNTVIRSATSIGDNVTIGSHCNIAHSLLMSDVQVGAMSHLVASVVGRGSLLGTHISASSGDIDINYRQQLHHVESVGALIGDDCRLGNQVSLASGTILHALVRVSDFQLVRDNINEGVELR